MNWFPSHLSSITSFEEEYKKIYFEKEKRRIFYVQALIAIDRSVRLGDISGLKRLNKLIGYLNEIENKSELKEFYDDNDNPMKESSLIILTCKYNKINVLEYLFIDQNQIVANLTTTIGLVALSPHDKDEMGRSAFYYAIREANVPILDMLISRWPGNYFSSPARMQELDDLLSTAYEELKLQNVLLPEQMEISVERKLVNRRFIFDVSKSQQNQNIQTTLDTVQKRIDIVLENIQLLQTEYFGGNEVDEKFLFVARFIAQNIHVLKKQLKSTYAMLPWEEIEFCVVSFISSQIKQQEINLIYNSILTKDKLLIHLGNFAVTLIEEKKYIKDAHVNSKLPQLNREKVVLNIVAKHPFFEDLYNDHEEMRSVYSLKKIVDYIELALLANPQTKQGQLIIQRALQVTGENLKNTLESPNLSSRISEILLSSGLQNDTILIIKSLRNFLSHSFSLSKRIEIEKIKDANFFNNIQNDLGKINIEISDILHQNKLKAMRLLLNKIISSKDLEETKTLILVFKNVQLDEMRSESFKTREQEKIAELIIQLKDKITDITHYEQSLFEKIDELIYGAKMKFKPAQLLDYKFGFVVMKVLYDRKKFSNHISDEVQGLKFLVNCMLDSITPKSTLDFQKIAELSIKIFNNITVRSRNNNEEMEQLFAKEQMKINNNVKLGLRNDREIELIILRIVNIVEFKSGKLSGIEDLRRKLSTNIKEDEATNIENEMESIKAKDYLSERLDTLKILLSSKELITSKLIGQFPSYKHDKKLQVATEMLVLDITENLQHLLGNNRLLFDTYSPLLIGKSLRNHLAHGNALVDILPYDSTIAVILNAIRLVEKKKKLIGSYDILVGRPILDDLPALNNHYCHNLRQIISQKEMFDTVRTGNLEKFQYHITKGADIKTRDTNNRTLLHFAVIGGNLEIMKFLLKHGLDINARDIDGQNPLFLAVSLGNKKVLAFIIETGVSMNECLDERKRTLLHIAAQNGSLDIVRYLLKNKADTRVKDMYDWAPLHYAVQNNYIDVVKILLNKENNADINELAGGYTPLYLAVEYGHIEVVDFLINNKANINATNDLNWTPLHSAALKGHPDVVNTLILNGAYVNANNIDGYMPLHYALGNGHEKTVNILLQHGANVNAVDIVDKHTYLHYAAKTGYSGIAGDLLINNANVNALTNKGMTPLHFAAEHNRLEIVGILIENKADVNAKSCEGTTPLHLAANNANEKIVELLIRKGANVNVKSCESMTPLHFAAQNINPGVIKVLISNGANINSKLTNNNTPLHAAALCDNKEVVEALIDQGAYVNAAGRDNCTPLHCATANGNKDSVKVLIENGADVNARGVDNFTPLHLAAANGYVELVDFLIQNKANVNSKCKDGFTPLHLAVRGGHKKIVETLILKGANVNVKNNNKLTPLDLGFRHKEIIEILIANKADVKIAGGRAILAAVYCGYKDVVEVFLKNKVDVNLKYCDKRRTLLHIAAEYGHKNIVQVLIENGADISGKVIDNLTPLYYAAIEGHKEVVEMLLANGANIDAKSIDGTTPLHIAASRGHSNVVKVLLNHGASNITDSQNRTPIELAVAFKHLQVIKLLLQNKEVNVNAKGNDNFTLLHIAAQEGNLEITKYLVDHEADINAENAWGTKPIHIAAREGHRSILEFFINKGISINDRGAYQSTLLHYAAGQGQLEVAKYLIEQKFDLNATDINCQTPMHIAAHMGYKDVVEVLLNHGAIYNPADKFNRKPLEIAKNESITNIFALTSNLFEAVKCNNHIEIEGLIKNGAFVNARNTIGVTPLHYGAWKGGQQTIDTLLKNKANPNAIGKNGWTPLHYATKFNHLDIVKVLLVNGAVYNAMADGGKIPLDFATHQGIVNLLKLINNIFINIEKCDLKVFDDLKRVKDSALIKAIMNTRNRENRTVIVAAIHRNFPKIELLKEMSQDNVSIEIEMAIALFMQERFDESLRIFESVLKKRIEILGADNPGTLDIQMYIGKVFYEQKYYQKALNIFEEVYQKQKHMLGLHNTNTLSTRSIIALVLHRQGNNDEALQIYQEVCQKQKEILGPNNLEYLASQQHMSLVLEKQKKYDDALRINREIYSKLKIILGPTHTSTLTAQNNTAMVLNNQGKHEEALKLYTKVYEKRKAILGQNHSDTLRTLHNMSTVYAQQGNHERQLKGFEEVFKIQKVALGPGHFDTLTSQCNIANILFAQCKYIGALKHYKAGFDQRKAILGPNHPDILDTTTKMQFIDCYLKMQGIDPNILEKGNINIATINGHIEIVENLLENGTDVNTSDVDGRTPLHYASNNGHIGIVNLLLKNMADATKASKKGNTPLHTATLKSYNEVVNALLQHVKTVHPSSLSILINAKTIVGGTTSLHIAAQNNNKEIVVILLKNGAHYDTKNTQGKTPEDIANGDSKNLLNTISQLFKAVSNCEMSNIESLLEEKDCNVLRAILSARNSNFKTLLQVANIYKQRNIAELIIKKLKFSQSCD